VSVINQLLLDLEKRRASAAERGALPSHVRVMPDREAAVNWGWVVAAGGAAIAALAAGWMLFAPAATRVQPPATRSGAEATIEKVVTASAGVAIDAKSAETADSPPPEVVAFRLSLELSALPPEPAPGRGAERTATDPAPRVAVRTESAKPAATTNARTATAAAVAKPQIQKHEHPPTPRELADNEYRKAVAALHQGRLSEAQEGFQAALNLHPEYHNARQGLVGLLVQGRQLGDAERVLQEGVRLAPAQTGFIMTLARLQVDRGDTEQAAAAMQRGLDYAQGNADYLAFFAALLQRQGRHEEAVGQFQAALRLKPGSGVWWLGLGMSQQAVNRAAEARDAYQRARGANDLHPELAAFADQRLKQLQ